MGSLKHFKIEAILELPVGHPEDHGVDLPTGAG
jgi:hypothetical protein